MRSPTLSGHLVGPRYGLVVSADLPPTDEGARRATYGISELVAMIAAGSAGRSRYLFGLAGPPGSGKSTVAARLAAASGGVVVPMDGFHLDNAELDRRGLSEVKGAPETFDADGFLRLVRRLRQPDGPVLAPSFDRLADRAVDAAITVDPSESIVIVEGNYLLLDRPPWDALVDLFDRTGYLVVDDAERVERLVARHVDHGRSPDAAREFVLRSDEANAAIVAASRHRADVFIDPSRP